MFRLFPDMKLTLRGWISSLWSNCLWVQWVPYFSTIADFWSVLWGDHNGALWVKVTPLSRVAHKKLAQRCKANHQSSLQRAPLCYSHTGKIVVGDHWTVQIVATTVTFFQSHWLLNGCFNDGDLVWTLDVFKMIKQQQNGVSLILVYQFGIEWDQDGNYQHTVCDK